MPVNHHYSLDEVNAKSVWLTIGAFDGVHLGHQAIIKDLVDHAHATSTSAVVITFHPHPATITRGRSGPYYLTDPEYRAKLLGDLGVDMVITHPFNLEISQTPADEFVAKICQSLAPSHLVVGEDFALGRNRAGNVDKLRELSNVFNYRLEVIKPIKNDNLVISSSHIRKALADGDINTAQKMLGRPYRVSGKVIPGDGRGRLLGIPTANLDIWSELMLPKTGVYACKASLQGTMLNAVTNIGIRPTFEDQRVSLRVETHLLDFNQDLYGELLHLDFIARLRDELRFANYQALIDQIKLDIASAEKELDALLVEKE